MLEQAVAKHPFVKGLAAPHLEVLIQCAMLTRFDAEQVIFHEGEIANRFYLIQSGKVSLETSIGETGVISIETAAPGDVIGWSWLFPPYYWHFSARALEPTEAIFFYGTRLRESCENDRELGFQVMRRITTVVMHRLQATINESLRLAQSG